MRQTVDLLIDKSSKVTIFAYGQKIIQKYRGMMEKCDEVKIVRIILQMLINKVLKESFAKEDKSGFNHVTVHLLPGKRATSFPPILLSEGTKIKAKHVSR